MNAQQRIPIVLFAQVPPPEHGQSRMVKLALDALRDAPERFDVHHVNARFSESLEDIGESSLRKGFLITTYLLQALRIRLRLHSPLLYYVPGPAKWSAVLRDWLVLAALRLFYRKVVFHWHAIGHGEWAHGSSRLTLEGPAWLDKLARKISAVVLDSPYASISVTESSAKDSASVGSLHPLVVCNGIEDPCPDFDQSLAQVRREELRELATSETPRLRILFLSHGTIEKGLFDALEALRGLMERADPSWRFAITFAGGVSEMLELRFEREIAALREAGGGRLDLLVTGYLSGAEKNSTYRDHDIFLAPSRWESFGLTVLEAMAHGMRVVAASSDGVSGVLPADHPYLAPVANPAALRDKLSACCADLRSDLHPRQGEILRRIFLERYQIRSFSEHLRDAIVELAESRSELREAESATAARPAETPLPGREEPITIRVYLADQNPGHDRSFGISRMSQVVLDSLRSTGGIQVNAIVSKTSQQAPDGVAIVHTLPWGTRRKTVRLLTDHLHPLFTRDAEEPALHYFPKGYLPLFSSLCRPSVVTIHDTIIQYDEDHYPNWRKPREYTYWAMMLKHTLRSADRILTVSESSKRQITEFMGRHHIPGKEITVTYEPCLYERLPQPEMPAKENYVIHLASCEPHKRTAHLVRWWSEAEAAGGNLPMLHLIGTVPPEVAPLLASSRSIVKRPFLEDTALQAAYAGARALILPSEIEGFGLPALEAYYLGTPVCFVRGTSVEEVLAVATDKGGFSLDSSESLLAALKDVMAMHHDEVRACGLRLRETYAAEKVATRMIRVFREVALPER